MPISIKNNLSKLTERSQVFITERASYGLYLSLMILGANSHRQKKIALPSFVCQSPLAAIYLAGWEPVFCDISIENGNVLESEWDKVIKTGVDAILFVHMFGAMVNVSEIEKKCKQGGVFFIEDSAQGFGGKYNSRLAGNFGDISLISSAQLSL